MSEQMNEPLAEKKTNVLIRLYRGETNIDFIGRRKLWFGLSGIIIIGCLLVLPFRPTTSSCAPPLPGFLAGLNCGIEFKGGLSIQAPISSDSELTDLDDLAVIERVQTVIGEGEAQVQVALEDDGTRSVIVQTSAVGEAEEQAVVADEIRELTGASVAESPTQRIGRKWGGEITAKAVRALFIFLIVVSIFISIRFEWKMAFSAVAAMIHDLIVTAGVYAAVGFEVTPSTVIAILTILGYSLYDNVVVFDKVEENTTTYAATGRMTYQDSANMAVNQVFMRSLNTALTTMLPVGALLFIGAGLLGATTMKDLSLALLTGMLVGAYSSVFVAVPILTILKEREPKYVGVREKVERDAKKASLKPATAGVPFDAAESSSAPAATKASTRPQTPKRVGSKKAKRRKRR
jgi:preprotein translocase subunit SecF